jgi:hypothetical protein
MIRSNIDRAHSASSMRADISNSSLDYRALFTGEPNGSVLELFTLRSFQLGSWTYVRYS